MAFAALGAVAPCRSQAAWSPHRPHSAPLPRSNAAVAFDPARAQHLLFGGDGVLGALGDTWSYDGVAWAQATPPTQPPPRHAHMLFWDGARLVLFGGLGMGSVLGDTWTWNGQDWVQHVQTGSPAPRFSAPVAFHPPTGTAFMLGGQQSTNPLFLQDFWQWGQNGWSLVAQSTPLGPRSQSGITWDPTLGRLVLAGGHTTTPSRTFLDDTWTFDGATWAQFGGTPFSPGRSSFAMAWVATRGCVVLFGGYSGIGAGTRYGDTWELRSGGWQQIASTWVPEPRSGCYLSANVATGTALMFGGSTNTAILDDTWTYGDPNPPTVVQRGVGCSWGGGVPLLDAVALPWAGERLELVLSGLPPSPQNLPILVIGAAVPPFDLGSLGAPGCAAYLNPYLPLTPASGVNVGGRARWLIPVPAGLAGGTFDLQGIVVAPTANSLGIVVSNALGGVIR